MTTSTKEKTVNKAVEEKTTPTNAVVEKKTTALVVDEDGVINMEGDSGAGLEGADKDSFALPYLQVLQGLSPQLETVEGARPGKIINTLTNELFDRVTFVPCGFQRIYNRWVPRVQGGGFKGSLKVSEFERLMASGEAEEGTYVQDGKERRRIMFDGTELKDTRNHFILIVRDDGSYAPALMSLSSTQIKKSKRLMALISGYMIKNAKGALFNPPSFGRFYVASTVEESNAEGKWKSFEFAGGGAVSDSALYKAAKEFHAQVTSGAVVAAPPPEDEVVAADPNGSF